MNSKIKEDLEKLKVEILPESINLHSMIVKSVNMNAEPMFINTGEYDQLVSSDIRTEFELSDPINNMEVTIVLNKRVQHKLKD